ncbi:MAG: formyltransferase family protein [Elusimicrobiota bacterium]|jgi:folate-dependent phosphoribosylglycinamide formyltransferase PurN
MIRLLILTSQDHPYANLLLGSLARAKAFEGFDLLVLEQSGLVPKASRWQGLVKYFRVAGLRYVAGQVAKQFAFKRARRAAEARGDAASPWYPYGRLLGPRAEVAAMLHFDAGVRRRFSEFAPDAVVSLLSKEIVGKALLGLPRLGCFNFHPAPLPDYKGVSPTFWALVNGEAAWGVSVHRMAAGIDAGDLLYAAPVCLEGVRSEHDLYMRCIEAGTAPLADLLARLKTDGLLPRAEPPTGRQSRYFSLPTREAVARFLGAGFSFYAKTDFGG